MISIMEVLTHFAYVTVSFYLAKHIPKVKFDVQKDLEAQRVYGLVIIKNIKH